MNEKLHFSNDALYNRSLFLSDFNDINIYVEDIGKEYEYEEIFERLFEEKLNVFCVFPLGGKENVLRCHEQKGLHDNDGKLNVFIVDGDFDNIWDSEKRESENLIYLSKYNIESYLISKEATIQYMRTYLRCTRRDVEKQICFDEWKECQKIEAGKLFTLFAVAMHYYPDMPSVNGAVGKFMDDNGHLIESEYEKYRNDLSKVVPDLSDKIFEVEERVQNKFEGDIDQRIFSIICGKYLYESICRHLKKVKNRNINRDFYKSALISTFDISTLKFLRDRIDQLRFRDLSA